MSMSTPTPPAATPSALTWTADNHASKLRQLLLHAGRTPHAFLRSSLTGPLAPRAFHAALAKLHANATHTLYAHAEEGRFENAEPLPALDMEAEFTAADFYPVKRAHGRRVHAPHHHQHHHRRLRGLGSGRWMYTYEQGYRLEKTGMGLVGKRLLAGSYIAVGLLTLICFMVIAQHLDI